MPVSTGNYDSEGVNRLSFPAKTVDGEAVMVVEKQTRANQSTVMLADDGRIFEVVGTKLSELADDAKEEASKLFRIEYEIAGVKTRFNQVSAVIAGPRGAGMSFVSGVTLYRVKNGVIDAGQFIPLDAR